MKERRKQSTPAQPWERLPDESAPAWAAFVEYRELGPERSTEAVARKVAKSWQLIRRWCARHDWVARTAAYDSWLAELRQQEAEKAIREEQRRWAERERQQREELWETRNLLIQKYREMAQMPMREITRVAPDPEAPDQLVQVTIKPVRFNANSLAHLARAVAEVGNLAVERPTQHAQIDLNAQVGFRGIETRQQAEAYLKQFAERLRQQLNISAEEAAQLARDACPAETALLEMPE